MVTYNEKFFNDSVKQIADWQAQAYEPARKFGETIASTYEKYAQLNYAVVGDLVDYTVEQAHLNSTATDVKAYFEAQQNVANAFSESMTARAGEFVELNSDFQDKAQAAVVSASKKAAKATKATKSSRKAA